VREADEDHLFQSLRVSGAILTRPIRLNGVQKDNFTFSAQQESSYRWGEGQVVWLTRAAESGGGQNEGQNKYFK